MPEFAPAKVNLYLHVVDRRADGYHLLDSLVAFAAVGDYVSVSPANELSLLITGPFAPFLQADTDNLVLRAASALAVQAGIKAAGKLVLEKNLPVASGIGGGSADAAATLRLLCRFWNLEPDALGRLAGSLGADVPVCVIGQPALMSGIGDELASVPTLPDVGIVLVNPGIAVSTPAVFRARHGQFSVRAHLPKSGWPDIADLIATLRTAHNDLERPARLLAPAIGSALDAIAAAPGCLLARMSGSGATCFGLFSSPVVAHAAAQVIVHDGWWVWGGGLINVKGSGSPNLPF